MLLTLLILILSVVFGSPVFSVNFMWTPVIKSHGSAEHLWHLHAAEVFLISDLGTGDKYHLTGHKCQIQTIKPSDWDLPLVLGKWHECRLKCYCAIVVCCSSECRWSDCWSRSMIDLVTALKKGRDYYWTCVLLANIEHPGRIQGYCQRNA